MHLGKAVVKGRYVIVIVSLALAVLSVFGMMATRINYDMLAYLPDDIDTMVGQDILLDEFGKGAFSFLIVKGMPQQDVAKLRQSVSEVEHVDSVLWYDTFADLSIPMEMLPTKVYDAFNSGDSTIMAIFFDGTTSEENTMDAIRRIRAITNEQCFISGMSATVVDIQALCEREEPIYVGIAVALAALAMVVFLDGWLVPFVFLASIGISILINMGTNVFFGEISYITKALAAVLQLAVTMDYSIFLWHSYNEHRAAMQDNREAMAAAIASTLTSVVGSSVTTVAGFVALCFMSFGLGLDLGLVMAKGVVLGVIGCVTLLPSMILLMDKPLQRTKHRSILPDMGRFADRVLRVFPVFIVAFALIAVPAYRANQAANEEVYYDMLGTLPKDMPCVVANDQLRDGFDIASTHMALIGTDLPARDVSDMCEEIEDVDGVKYALSLESALGPQVPEDFVPEKLRQTLESGDWELVLISSGYATGSDESNAQVARINEIIKSYDADGLLIGEAPCTKDLIEITDEDFRRVNMVSIGLIFAIILLVEKSLTLPVILIAIIEVAIFINLGVSHVTGVSVPFIAPICISTIQLGATVDYAILMTTRYKVERNAGRSCREAVGTALATSIPSIIVSGMGLFAATFGVALYSDIDLISSICMLLARGALISMVCVILVLPTMLRLFDPVIRVTTLGMRANGKEGSLK
ncbi:MAG: hypothetical protein E7317_00085 [Clostridiales bacterium]|nr:hypothetical protein [Clostridiales bacterium]